MSTYSVYNIKVDNQLSFTPGPTAGYVLSIGSDGITYWSVGGGGGSGTSGTSGTNGATGATGSSGTSGTNGSTGATGSSGTSGTNGSTGATGSSGSSGSSGTSGVSGGGSSRVFLTNQSLTTGGWFATNSNYGYTFSNANIGTQSIVNFIPYNESYLECVNARVLPYNYVTASYSIFYSYYLPITTITGDIQIF